MRYINFLVCLVVFFSIGASGEEAPPPLKAAHSHNDYAHARPLLEALEAGFCSVEADIHLVDGQLLVAHDRDKVMPEKTLQSLYLEPLQERIRRNGGTVYAGEEASFALLIDLKSDGKSTYAALHEVLATFRAILTRFEEGEVHPGAVSVIISGNRPREAMKEQAIRYAGYDGRLADLEGDAPASFMPWISDNFRTNFQWRGEGALPRVDQEKLADIVHRTHRAGKKLRLWAAPDLPASWKALRDAGVDIINTDRILELRDFLLKADDSSGEPAARAGK